MGCVPSFTVFTDNDGYAPAWPFKLGPVGEINLVTATVSGTNLNVTFRATSTISQILPTPQLDPYPTVTNDPTPELSGSTGPNYLVNIYDEEGNLIASTTADSLGQWSIEMHSMLDGNYFFMIQATKDGNFSPYVFITLTIDTALPEIIISQPVIDQMITVTDNLIFNIHYSNSLSGIDLDTLSILLNNGEIKEIFNRSSSQAYYEPDLTTSDGRAKYWLLYQNLSPISNTLLVSIYDRAGNFATQERNFYVTLDTIEPPPPEVKIALEIIRGDEQEGLVGRCAEIPLIVRAYDEYGLVQSFEGIPLSFEISQGGGLFMEAEGYSTVTNEQGLAALHYHYGTG